MHNILGSGSSGQAVVYTHSNGIAMSQKANTSKASNFNASKNTPQEVGRKSEVKIKASNLNDNNKRERPPLKAQK